MQGADVLIAVDVGTSGARASGFDVSGAPLDEVRRSYPTYLPAEGWAEQDARRWQSAALSALGALVRSLGPRAQVRAVAVTGQCPSVVPLDRRDLPLGPGLIYRDNRATAEADWMRERFGDRELHELTGHVPAAFHVAAKIAWLRAHQPDVFAATRRFVQPTDYVALGLTGHATTDWSMAAATALLDLRARRWAPELLAALDLDPAMLPAVVASWSVAGEIRPKLARRLGLADGVPVVAGAGDSIACALGAGVTGAGPVSEMAGSSSCFNSVVAEPLPDRDVTHYPSITGLETLLTDGDAAHAPVRLCLDVGHQCVPGTTGPDRDPYAWLTHFGGRLAEVQLQQSDGLADHHWPFTAERNQAGRIDPGRVLDALAEAGAQDVLLVLEVIPAFEQDDAEALADLRASAELWQAALTERGAR